MCPGPLDKTMSARAGVARAIAARPINAAIVVRLRGPWLDRAERADGISGLPLNSVDRVRPEWLASQRGLRKRTAEVDMPRPGFRG